MLIVQNFCPWVGDRVDKSIGTIASYQFEAKSINQMFLLWLNADVNLTVCICSKWETNVQHIIFGFRRHWILVDIRCVYVDLMKPAGIVDRELSMGGLRVPDKHTLESIINTSDGWFAFQSVTVEINSSNTFKSGEMIRMRLILQTSQKYLK